MSGGSESPQQTTTTNQTLTPEQEQVLAMAMPGVKQFAATVPQRFQGDTFAGFNPEQTAAQNLALSAAGSQSALAGSGTDAANFYLNGNIWDPSTNPNLKGAIDAAVRPITQNYEQVVRPGIRDTYQAAGQQFGGSRQNISEALGADAYMRNVGDVGSKIVQGQYDTNINAQLKALGLVPSLQKTQTAGAETASAVGDVRQQMDQARINQTVGNFSYDQLAPFLQSQELVNIAAGIPGGGTTSHSIGNVPKTGQFSSALGGAAAGATLGSAFPVVGTAVGAGLGGLMGYLRA